METTFKVTIAAARTNAGLTQKEFADVLNVDRTTVINWEKGKYTPNLNHLRRISEITNIPMDYIFVPATLPKVETT